MAKQIKQTAKKKRQVTALNESAPMDIVMINALLDSLFTIFSTMVRVDIKPGVPVLKQDNIAKGVASGLIGMKAEGSNGSVALSLTLPAIRAISLGMLGEEFTSVDRDSSDMVGELTNMLVGGAKRILSEKGVDFDMHTPQLLVGDEHEIVHHYAGQTVLLPIGFAQGEFYIEMNFV